MVYKRIDQERTFEKADNIVHAGKPVKVDIHLLTLKSSRQSLWFPHPAANFDLHASQNFVWFACHMFHMQIAPIIRK